MPRIIKRTGAHLSNSPILRAVLIFIGVILLISVAAVSFHHKTPVSKKIVTAGTPVVARNSATAASNNSAPNSSVSPQAARNSGGAQDTNGTAKATTPQAQWITSASGVITVKQPSANAVLQSGDAISGVAKENTVHYRLKDNKVGVIAQGELSVVNGNFSGNLNFSPQGTGGQLDVFTTDSQGVEYNEVQINVSF